MERLWILQEMSSICQSQLDLCILNWCHRGLSGYVVQSPHGLESIRIGNERYIDEDGKRNYFYTQQQ